MLTVQFAQKHRLLWHSCLQHFQGPLNSTRHIRRISGPVLNMASARETTVDLCNGKADTDHGIRRRCQVIVAATREMGIGKKGKLPWTLPSDLRYFKEVTTTNSDDRKKNAVIMGRRTWESIPQKYRPLPGRLNVVLSRSKKVGLAALEDLVICTDLNSALKLLAEPPLSLSVEKVFIIGGGQVLKETLNAPGCEAIHLTDIETGIECDTFIPQIDSSLFFPLLSSRKIFENNIQFSFRTYVRSNNSAEGSTSSDNSVRFDSDTATDPVKMKLLTEWHAEFNYLKHIQEKIANGL